MGAGSSLCWMRLGSSAGSGGTEIHSVACASGLLAMVATWIVVGPQRSTMDSCRKVTTPGSLSFFRKLGASPQAELIATLPEVGATPTRNHCVCSVSFAPAARVGVLTQAFD
jgi:hypothetical protein